MIPKLKWYKDFDENGASVYEASSIYHDDGCPFLFRIRAEDDGTFTEQSDAEIIAGQPRSWPTLESAKEAIQSDHERMYANG